MVITRKALVTAPAIEPVTLDEAKRHAREDLDTEALDFEAWIQSARELAENLTGRALITQTWDLYLDAWPSPKAITLPMPPLVSVDSITYIDTDGNSQALASTEYTVKSGEPAVIVEAYGKTWPSLRDQADAVTIRVTVGYGTTAASVPASIRHWIKMKAADMHENREPTLAVQGLTVQSIGFADGLLDPYRMRTIL